MVCTLSTEQSILLSLDFNASLSVGAMCCSEPHLVVYGQKTKLDTKLRETLSALDIFSVLLLKNYLKSGLLPISEAPARSKYLLKSPVSM